MTQPANNSHSDGGNEPGGNPQLSPSAERRMPAAWVILALLLLASLVVGALVLQFFVARQLPVLTSDEFDEAVARWEANGPASYDMDIRIEGTRAGEVHVEVRHGEVTAMTRDGQTPSQRRTWDVWSVPGQFEMIEREIEMAEDPEGEMLASRGTSLLLRCEFDPELGYPRRFHRAVFGGGPEVFWEVTRFVPKDEASEVTEP